MVEEEEEGKVRIMIALDGSRCQKSLGKQTKTHLSDILGKKENNESSNL